MKKFIYAITIALATLVLFASCENSFSGTKLNTAPLKEQYASGRTNTTQGFKIASVTATSLENTKNQVITITASGAVDWNTLNDALKIYPLSNGEHAGSVWTRGTALSFELQEGYKEKEATILVNLTSIVTDKIELHFDASKLTGSNGVTKLNEDGDRYFGESEDDYIEYLTVTRYNEGLTDQGLAITPLNTYLGSDSNRNTQRTIFTGKSFESDDNGLVNSFTVEVRPFEYDSYTTPATQTGFLGAKIVDTTDYKALLDKALVFEAYDPVANRWNKITTTSTWNPTFSLTTGWDNAAGDDTRDYVVTFAAQPHDTNVRVRIENVQSIKSDTLINGYEVRYTYDNAETNEVLGSATSKDSRNLTLNVLSKNEQTNLFVISTNPTDYDVQIILDYKTDSVASYKKVTMGASGANAKIINSAYVLNGDIKKTHTVEQDNDGLLVVDTDFTSANGGGTRLKAFAAGDIGTRFKLVASDENTNNVYLEGGYYYTLTEDVCDYETVSTKTWMNVMGAGGLDLTTLTTDNIKIISNNKEIPIASISTEYTDKSIDVPTRVVIKLKKEYKYQGKTFDLYLGAGLKTAGGITGVDTNVTPSVNLVTVPAKSFGDATSINAYPNGFTKWETGKQI